MCQQHRVDFFGIMYLCPGINQRDGEEEECGSRSHEGRLPRGGQRALQRDGALAARFASLHSVQGGPAARSQVCSHSFVTLVAPLRPLRAVVMPLGG